VICDDISHSNFGVPMPEIRVVPQRGLYGRCVITGLNDCPTRSLAWGIVPSVYG